MKLILFFVLAFFSMNAFAKVPPIEPGISRDLAKWRKEHYSDVRYKLDLVIKKMSPTLHGKIEITVKVDKKGSKDIPIVLDWRKIRGHEEKSTVQDATLNGEKVTPEEINEHLVFRNGIDNGENKINITFTSPILKSGSAITRYVDREDGSEYIYSLFVPSDASTAFPLFDQPDLKARFKLSVYSRLGIAVSNTVIENDMPMREDFSRKFPSLSFTSFAETRPISSYVFAFALGNFEKVDESEFSDDLIEYSGKSSKISRVRSKIKGVYRRDELKRGKEIQVKGSSIYVRKSQAEKFKKHAKEVFRINRESIEYFEKYFDYKFPFSKYDLVLIPEFPFGGMEHVGATFLRERSVIFPTEPTANNYIARASVIIHEAAHQWFGDLVTMEWFDDLWLKEGFATFMSYKAMEEILPKYDAWKTYYERTKPGAYTTDITKGTTPIYQEIPNLSAAKSAYGNIVYRKAPSFLKQAEFYLGEKEFQEAVQLFLRHHAFGNADWQSLVTAFEMTSKRKLDAWAQAWVKTRGLPVIRVKKSDFRSYPRLGGPHDTAYVYNIEQWDALDEGGKWPFKTKAVLRFEDGTDEIKEVSVTDRPTKRGFARYWVYFANNPSFKPNTPVFVFPNYDDKAYAIVLLDPRSRRYVLENIGKEKNEFLRSMMWGALWDSVRFEELDPSKYVELVADNIGIEKSDTTISSLLGRSTSAFTYFLNQNQKDAVAPKLERAILKGMTSAETNGQLITFSRPLKSRRSASSLVLYQPALGFEFFEPGILY